MNEEIFLEYIEESKKTNEDFWFTDDDMEACYYPYFNYIKATWRRDCGESYTYTLDVFLKRYGDKLNNFYHSSEPLT